MTCTPDPCTHPVLLALLLLSLLFLSFNPCAATVTRTVVFYILFSYYTHTRVEVT